MGNAAVYDAGRKPSHAGHGNAVAEKDQKPDYYRQRGTTPKGGPHSVLLDANGNLLNDPYEPDIPLTNTRLTPIYLHGNNR
jgi:hypothetical protein